jgi:hypothetical protein
VARLVAITRLRTEPVTGVPWTVAGGVPRSFMLGFCRKRAGGERLRLPADIRQSHRVQAGGNPPTPSELLKQQSPRPVLGQKPAFMIHTGDITHPSRPEEFDNSDQVISSARLGRSTPASRTPHLRRLHQLSLRARPAWPLVRVTCSRLVARTSRSIGRQDRQVQINRCQRE